MSLYQSIAVMVLSVVIPVAVAAATHAVRKVTHARRIEVEQVQREDARARPHTNHGIL